MNKTAINTSRFPTLPGNMNLSGLARKILIMSAIIGLALFTLNMIYKPFQTTAFILLGFLLSNLVSLILLRLKKYYLAMILLMTAAITAVTGNMIIGEGLSDPGIIALPLLLSTGGLFLGRRSIIPMSIVFSLLVNIITFLERGEFIHVKQPTLWIWTEIFTVLFLGAGAVLYIILKSNEDYQVQIKKQFVTIHNQKEELRKSLEEKEFLMKEIYHRVKNNLQMVHAFLSYEESHMESPHDKQVLKDCQFKINAMSLIHEKLYQSTSLERMDLDLFLDEILDIYRDQAQTMGLQLEIEREYEDVNISPDQAVYLGLIINELLTNSIKHAFSGKPQGQISLSLKNTNREFICMEYRDNGTGFSDTVQRENSLGQRLLDILARSMGGEIIYKNNDGAHYSLTAQRRS